MDSLIKNIYNAQLKVAELDSEIEKLKAEKAEVENQMKSYSDELMSNMKKDNLTELTEEGLYANYFSKENVSYKDEKQVLDYLKNNGYSNLIRLKTTESLDKTPLKKALKTDSKLAEALNELTIRTTTEYVTVTTEENHTKMLEHIETAKGK